MFLAASSCLPRGILQRRGVRGVLWATLTLRGCSGAVQKLPPLPRLDLPAALLASHGFSETANWLVPGLVLVGANPHKGPENLAFRLASIRGDAGCGTFVSLQREAEEQAKFGDYHPAARLVRAIDKVEPTFLRLPIEDFQPAESLSWIEGHVQMLADRVADGEIVYMHCAAGRGRTGLMAACLLGALYEGLNAEEALKRVGAYYRLRDHFKTAESPKPPLNDTSPETETQFQQVRDFYSLYRTTPEPAKLKGG
ncbi:protein-tyrosine phosphatase-like protein [Pelagophyceae sp. CCMP2097]|nr:protein-tyrosine phosphatase-like protein [Pelagophyceae sp. CCMP2097]|mmetsp:Transcript_13207/g.45764  ORF Transcript_13207/g.45764 Transcript_13207/m.45764 type:complete len:254 (+) Transcript_13207:92-853(+)